MSDLLRAVKEVLPDLEHYAATHGPGPDRRLAELKQRMGGPMIEMYTSFRCRDCGSEVYRVRITRREAFLDIETGEVTYEEAVLLGWR